MYFSASGSPLAARSTTAHGTYGLCSLGWASVGPPGKSSKLRFMYLRLCVFTENQALITLHTHGSVVVQRGHAGVFLVGDGQHLAKVLFTETPYGRVRLAGREYSHVLALRQPLPHLL